MQGESDCNQAPDGGSYTGVNRETPELAVILPVGPKPVDVLRAVCVIESLVFWEPATAWCVIVNDSGHGRGLAGLAVTPPTCTVVELVNPRRGSGGDWRGAVAAAVLVALRWIHSNTDAELALKIDTDALVIGPFAGQLRASLVREPGAGIVGSFGSSCNPAVRATERVRPEATLRVAARQWPTECGDGGSAEGEEVPGLGQPSVLQRRAFDAIRSHVDAAIANGYFSNNYCQGGAYAISSLMLDRMASAGYLEHPEVWTQLPVYEELALAMYASAVGLTLHDATRPGEPFGIQWIGLPYAPEELVARGHSLIHSVKNDRTFSELEIRAFFRDRQERSRQMHGGGAAIEPRIARSL